MKATLYRSCVTWPKNDVDALTDMVQGAEQVTRKTFLRHVDRDSLASVEKALGYADHPARGLTMGRDQCVTYLRGVIRGKTGYFFDWSCIEHVFTDGGARP